MDERTRSRLSCEARVTQPIGAPHEAAALILFFLAHVGSARITRIVTFMATEPLRVAPGTTRNTIGKLVRARRLERVGRGRYKAPAGGIAPGATR